MDGLAFVQLIEVELAKRNITKEKFYNESGISSATMSQWRKNKYSPSSAAIKKIEDYFGITISIGHSESDSVFSTNRNDSKKNTPSEPELTEGEKKLIALFRKVPADRQELVLKMIEDAIELL